MNKERLKKRNYKELFMSKIKIVTDSTVDLDQSLLEELEIEMIPLTITVDGQSYLDHVDYTSTQFVEILENAKEFPKTSQPAIGTFVELYERLGKEGYEVLSIHMTSGMSGTVRAAQTAATMVDTKVTVVDSQYISTALNFQVIEAAKMAKEGATVEEILPRLEHIRNNSFLYIMVDTLEYLKKGGRIGKATAFLGSLLKIKPIAMLKDGALEPVTKVRSHMQVIKQMLKYVEKDSAGKVIKGIGIAQLEAMELANKLKDSLLELRDDITNVPIYETGGVIGSHTGPNAFALMYWVDEK